MGGVYISRATVRVLLLPSCSEAKTNSKSVAEDYSSPPCSTASRSAAAAVHPVRHICGTCRVAEQGRRTKEEGLELPVLTSVLQHIAANDVINTTLGS